MEREITSNEDRLYNLMQSTPFETLTSEEQDFVLTQTTEDEYNSSYRLLSDSKSLNDGLTAKPLVLPNKKQVVVIPLYQALAAVAAAVLVSFFAFRSSEIITNTIKIPSGAVADTVYIDNSRYDTVLQREIKYLDRVKYEKVRASSVERASLPSRVNISVPEISSDDLTTVGVSMKDDETYVLVEDLISENQNVIFRRD